MTAPPDTSDQATIRWRPIRRALVVTFAASTAILLVAGFFELEPGWVFNLVSFGGGMLSPVAALAILAIMRFVPSQPDGKLDERLRTVRDRAHRTAYQLLSITVLSLLLTIHIRAWWFDLLPTHEGIVRWMLGLGMVTIAAPAAVMAWTEPEP